MIMKKAVPCSGAVVVSIPVEFNAKAQNETTRPREYMTTGHPGAPEVLWSDCPVVWWSHFAPLRLCVFALKLFLAGILIGAASIAEAQVPTNFPALTVTTNYPSAVANGYVFMANNTTPTNVGNYVMIIS